MKEGCQIVESKDYISVSEFAKRANRSKQAIYLRTKTTLKDYTLKNKGQLYISVAALGLIDDSQGSSQDSSQESSQVSSQIQGDSSRFQGVSSHESSQVSSQGVKDSRVDSSLDREKQLLFDELERLKKELDEARADIRRKDEQLETMTARLMNIAENQNELLRNSQILQAQAQHKRGFLARLFAPKEDKQIYLLPPTFRQKKRGVIVPLLSFVNQSFFALLNRSRIVVAFGLGGCFCGRRSGIYFSQNAFLALR